MSDSPFADVEDGSIDEEPEPVGGTSVDDSIPGRLFDGNAVGPSVEELQTDYSLPWHWATALRGCCRVMTGDGVPPVFEIGLGGALGAADQLGGDGKLNREPGGNDQQEQETKEWSE